MNKGYPTSQDLQIYLEDIDFRLENDLRKINSQSHDEETLRLQGLLIERSEETRMKACTYYLLAPYTLKNTH